MNRVVGVICLLKKNRTINIVNQPFCDFNFELDHRHAWKIGIDQSTNCCGMSFIDTEDNYLIQLDVKRDKALEKTLYYRELAKFFKKTLMNQNIKWVLYEKPVPSRFKNAGDVLRELKGHLDEWLDFLTNSEEIVYDSMYPQSWKSQVVNTALSKNRFNEKALVAYDVTQFYPLLHSYYENYPFSDYDSFDATGILIGYKKAAFTEDDIPKIWGTKEKTHVSFVGYRWVSCESLKNGKGAIDIFGETVRYFKPKFLAYNLSFSLHDNIRMASSTYDVVYTLLPKEELQRFQWLYDINIEEPNFCMLMYVIRKGRFSNSEFKALKSILPWNEEVLN